MVSLSFSSFMLVMLLFIFLTIKDTIAHTDDQVKQTFVSHEAENDNARALQSHLSVEKEVLDGVPTAAEFSNEKMGGRKMMIERTENTKQVEKADSSGSSNNSASPLGESRKNIHNDQKLLEDETEFFSMMNQDYGDLRNPRRKPPTNNFQPIHTSNP